MAEAHYLSDKDGKKFYPYAHVSATYDNDGNTVDKRLKNIDETLSTAVQSVKIGDTEYKSGTTVTLPEYPTSLPASDTTNVYNPDGTTPASGKAIASAISTKVDKVSGKSLISDTEITRLASVKNYDDTAIKGRVSTLENAGYITKAVSDLTNYYKKSETYTQAEVNNLISAIPKFAISVVESLPTSNISTTTIYLLKTSTTETGNLYTEYIYVNSTWEKLGTQTLDLSGYTTTSALSTGLSGKVDKVSGKGLSTNDLTSALKTNYDAAYTHSTSAHARTDATKVEKSSTNGNIVINGTETNVYTHPSGTNPHGTTKSDVGLGNVGNFKAVSTVANQGLSDTEKANARSNIGAGSSSFSGSYNDLTNKPTIPSVGNGTVTITQNGTSKGTFTMNQSGNTTIALTDTNTNTTYSAGSQLALSGTTFKLNDFCTTVTDWNSATKNGWYMASNATNAPVSNGGWFYGFVVAHLDTYCRQILWHFATDGTVNDTNCDRYERVKHNGTWGSWINTSVRVAVPSSAKFTDTTYADATTSAHGLMTAAMVTKLNGIATGANAYTHPTTSGNKHIPSGGSSGQILRWSADGTAVWGADNNTTYSTGTTSYSGTTKLYTGTGSATDGTMTQSAITTALNGKQAAGSYAASNHTHNYAGSSSAGGSANSLSYFQNTSSTNVGQAESGSNAIAYITDYSGTALTSNVKDGALYRQAYSANWVHQIYGDYRTGQIAVRGKNNGTWQNWRRILDESNYNNYAPSKTGTGASGTWGINVTGSAGSVAWTNVSGRPSSMTANGGNSDTVDGFHASQSAGSKSTCVVTDANGYTNLNYINSNTGNNENPGISQIIVTNGSDNYYRKASLAHLKSSLGSMPASDVYSWAKASTKPSYSWSEIGSKPSTYTPAAGSLNYVKVWNSSNLGSNDNWSVDDLAKQHFAMAMVNNATDNPAGAKKWHHVISMAWTSGSNTAWVSQLAMGVEGSDGLYYRTTQGTIVGAAWKRVLDSSNYKTYCTPANIGAAASSHTHSNYLTGITKAMVTTALGYTPPTTDTNTWRGIQNNLTSTSTTDSLSAYQGKLLRDMIHRVIVQSSEPSISTNDEWLLEY